MNIADGDGNLFVKALPAGEYEMKVLKPGFATYLAPQVVLDPGRDLAMTAKLNIGSTNETVDVQAEGSAKSAAAAQALEAEAKSKATRIRIGGNVEAAKVITRSEEHTSELQSRLHLVCRLLLEKKKIYIYNLILYLNLTQFDLFRKAAR